MDNDAIAGKEQSTPPEIRTIISPIANIIGMVRERSWSTILLGVKNCPLLTCMMRQKAIRMSAT